MNGKRGIGGMIMASAAVLTVLAAGCAAQGPQPALTAGQPDTTASSSPARPAPVPTCPATLGDYPKHWAFPPAPSASLVPGTPQVAAVCRYAGINDPHPNALVKSATVAGAMLTSLTVALNKAQPSHGVYSCPAEFGLYDLVVFSYPDRGPVDVIVDATGCTQATNGHRQVMFAGDALTRIAAVVGRGTIVPQ